VDVAELVGDADLLVRLQDNVQAKLTQRLQEALGEQFFCAPTFHSGGGCGDPTFVLKKVDIPASVTKAFEDVRTSEIKVQTKENEIRQREAEARAIAALGLSGQEYDILKAIESGKISFWVLPRQRCHDHRARQRWGIEPGAEHNHDHDAPRSGPRLSVERRSALHGAEQRAKQSHCRAYVGKHVSG
jgi:hypothetical protein